MGVAVMARRKAQRDPRSGAPGIGVKRNAGAPALNPIGINQPGRFKHGHYLDPTVALGKVPHPSAEWADIELQPCKPRE